MKTDYGKSDLNWTLFSKALESKASFLLFAIAPIRQFYIIPKRAFSSRTEETAFRELMKRKSLLTQHR